MSFQSNKKLDNKGFTLIELLVVMAILVLVYGAIFINFNVVEYLAQAKDAKRVSELLNIQTALVTAVTNSDIRLIDTLDCTTCNTLSGSRQVNGTGWIRYERLSEEGMQKYLAILPTDPVNEGITFFSFYSDANSFELNAKLESEKYADFMRKDGGNDDSTYERGLNLTLK